MVVVRTTTMALTTAPNKAMMRAIIGFSLSSRAEKSVEFCLGFGVYFFFLSPRGLFSQHLSRDQGRWEGRGRGEICLRGVYVRMWTMIFDGENCDNGNHEIAVFALSWRQEGHSFFGPLFFIFIFYLFRYATLGGKQRRRRKREILSGRGVFWLGVFLGGNIRVWVLFFFSPFPVMRSLWSF